jgi:hypothetical protein
MTSEDTTEPTVWAGSCAELEQLLGHLPDDHPQRPVVVVLEDTLGDLFGLTADLHRALMEVRSECDSIGLDLANGWTLDNRANFHERWADVEFMRARRVDALESVKRLADAVNATPGPIRVDLDSVLWDVANRGDVRR